MTDTDLIIIGAGPAGMAAASTAAHNGLRVLLLDEQPRAGGQIYRDVALNSGQKRYLGKDYRKGRALVDALNLPNIRQEFGAVVWRLTPGSHVVWSQNGVSQVSTAPHILIAGGAQERPTPFPGWTLPGVMTVGAAQVLMKNAGLLPRDAVLAGSGPLLYLVAAQLIDAGARPRALVETQSLSTLVRASYYLPRALLAAPTLIKGLGLLLKIKRAGVERFMGASGFNAKQTAEGNVSFTFQAGDKTHSLETPLLLTHQGVVPSTHMSRTSGVEHKWNDVQETYQPITDVWGGTNVAGVHIAGDGAGISGADAARAAGRLAAYDILYQLGLMSKNQRNQKAKWSRLALHRAMSIRPFLDAAYPPSCEISDPLDETIVCRCEEVNAAAIRKSYHEGALGPRHIKTATRAGMGPCQGRMCDLTVKGILTACGAQAQTPRARTPIKPVKLGELAMLAKSKSAE